MLNLGERHVIFSVKPEYADKIVTGKKTVELRRRFAGEAVIGSIAFIYSTSPVRAIIGYARIADVRRMPLGAIWESYSNVACVSRQAFDDYFDGVSDGFVIVLSNAKPLPNSVQVADLQRRYGFHPPQSYTYAGKEYQELIA